MVEKCWARSIGNYRDRETVVTKYYDETFPEPVSFNLDQYYTKVGIIRNKSPCSLQSTRQLHRALHTTTSRYIHALLESN